MGSPAATPADLLRLLIPGVLALILIVVSAAPVSFGQGSFTPNVVLLMSLSIGMLYPAAWPPALAFFLGLASDLVFGTPLGAQGLLALTTTLLAQAYARHGSHQLFHVRWIEAGLTLLVLHGLLWLITRWVLEVPLPFTPVLMAAGVNALWFPLFYGLSLQLARLLPSGG